MNSKVSVMTVEEYRRQISKRKARKERETPEHNEQVKLFKWAEIMANRYEELDLLFAIPNGAYFMGNWKVINTMKAEGLKSGVPDVFLPIRSKEFSGLWIEMKAGSNRPSPAQKKWIRQLREQGFRVEVCYSADEAIEVICKYLNLND